MVPRSDGDRRWSCPAWWPLSKVPLRPLRTWTSGTIVITVK